METSETRARLEHLFRAHHCEHLIRTPLFDKVAARVEELESALLPFAVFAEKTEREHPGWYHPTFYWIGAHERWTMEPFMRARSAMTPPADPNAVPSHVYYSAEADNFYEIANGRGMGWTFYQQWKPRCAEFPTQPKP